MDADLEAVEIVLAQKLACGEPTTRKRALKALHDWLRNESKSTNFDVKSMERLCKGLHYVMWMQDKMLLQEELADSMGNLVNIFCHETQSVLFVKSMLTVLSNEWPRIDRWRMDKFLMLIRRIVRFLFARLRQKDWSDSVADLYMEAFKDTVISTDKSFSEGLKFHFSSVYLDELDNAGGLTPDRVTEFLRPFADLLGQNGVTNYLFDSILEEVFVSILHLYADEKAAREDNAGDEEMPEEETSSSGGLKFNYDEIGRMLFDTGKQASVKSERRKRLYAIVQKFKAANVGEDPFVTVTSSDLRVKTAITKSEMSNAVSGMLNEHAKDVAAKLKEKKKRKLAKRQRDEQSDEITSTAAGFGEESLPGKAGKTKRLQSKKKRPKAKIGALRPRKEKKTSKVGKGGRKGKKV